MHSTSAEPAGPTSIPQPFEAASPNVPQASSHSVTPSDSANLAQAVAALDTFRSDSGDTGLERQGGDTGTSGGRSSDDRRRDEAGQSEQTPSPSLSKNKRLKQNRLAAKKSRQRRKEYVLCLEDQVRALRDELRREQQGKGNQRAEGSGSGSAGPSRGSTPPALAPASAPALAPTFAPGHVRAISEPPRYLSAAEVPNPFQAAGEGQQQLQLMASPNITSEGPRPLALQLPLVHSITDPASQAVVHAFEQWHVQHASLVRALLAVRNQSSMEGPLAERLMAVLAHLRDFFRLKAAALQGPDAHLVLSLQHLPQGQRRFAPLGVLSCSDICAGLLDKLGPALNIQQRLFLDQHKGPMVLQQALMTQEATFHMLLSRTIAEVTQIVAQARVPLGLPGPMFLQPATADAEAKLQVMCQIFLEADRLWQEFLLHAEHFLSVPQFVTVVSAMAEVGAGLEEVWQGQDRSRLLALASLTQAMAASQV